MGKKHQEGFTLIELLVLMMVIAIALGLGIPAFSGMAANGRMSAASNDLVSSLHTARTEALMRARSVTMCASSDWDADAPGCDPDAGLLDGWIVFVDTLPDGPNGAVDDGEAVLQVHGPLDDTIRLQDRTLSDGAAPAYLSYRADGFPQDIDGLAAVRNIQLCDTRNDQDTGDGRAAGRWIAVSAAGRPVLFDRVAQLQGTINPLGGC